MTPIKTTLLFLLIAAAVLLIAGCASAPPPAQPEPIVVATVADPTPPATNTPAPMPTATPEPTAEPEPAAQPEPASEPTPTAALVVEEPTATPEPEPELSLAETLALGFSAPPTAAGEVILVTGRVLDLAGNPLPGAAVEFWQTDAAGVYDHPGESGTGGRDRGFQFFGTSIADADGRYVFRTVVPGRYAPRPRHIHVKVKQDGRTLLTTQFYFEEERARQGDRLILSEIDTADINGAPVAVLANDLVVNTGSPVTLTATPSQGEGPYYPVVPVADFDNDLVAVP